MNLRFLPLLVLSAILSIPVVASSEPKLVQACEYNLAREGKASGTGKIELTWRADLGPDQKSLALLEMAGSKEPLLQTLFFLPLPGRSIREDTYPANSLVMVPMDASGAPLTKVLLDPASLNLMTTRIRSEKQSGWLCQFLRARTHVLVNYGYEDIHLQRCWVQSENALEVCMASERRSHFLPEALRDGSHFFRAVPSAAPAAESFVGTLTCGRKRVPHPCRPVQF